MEEYLQKCKRERNDCMKKLRTERQVVKILKNHIKKLDEMLEKKYKKRGRAVYRRGRKTVKQQVDHALAKNKRMRNKEQAIYEYNRRRARNEDAQVSKEDAKRVAKANASLDDFFARFRFQPQGTGANIEWNKAMEKARQLRERKRSIKNSGGRRKTRRKRRKCRRKTRRKR